MDRTNWKFGSTNINIMVLAVVYEGVAFPLLYMMMPKFGNSSTKKKIVLISRFIRLFGQDSIECLLANKYFVDKYWISYLNLRGFRYHIRIRENFWVELPRNRHLVKASCFFSNLKVNQCAYYPRIVLVNGKLCYLSAQKLLIKKGFPELQFIISFNKPDKAQLFYTKNVGK